MDELITWLRAIWDEDERSIWDADAIGAQASAISHDQLLDEIKAKRRILDWLVDCADKAASNNWWNLDVDDAITALAQPYDGRDGWREEWRA